MSAIALVHKNSKLNQVLMSFMLKTDPPSIPVKAFSNKKKALDWLTKQKTN